jgi:glycosyltransferase involved in cell wall biosynthesis
MTHYNINVKNIVNIQDIQQKHFPNFFSKTEVARREYRYYNTLFCADHLVFSSKFIYRDVLKYYDFINEKKFSIIPEGVNCNIYKYKKDKNLSKKKYFFLPAQLWPHKNHLTVIKSFNEFNKKNKYKFKLFICGKSFQNNSNLLDLIKNTKNCFYLGLVSQNLIIKLMSNAIATISPSLYESSSLTLLEAIACRCLVIASDIEPNKEKKSFFKIFYFKRTSINNLKKIFFKVSLIEKKIKKNYLNKNARAIQSHTWKSFNTNWLNTCKN